MSPRNDQMNQSDFPNFNDLINNTRTVQLTPMEFIMRRSKKPSKLRVTGLCEAAQKVSYAENVSIWWRHNVLPISKKLLLSKTFTTLYPPPPPPNSFRLHTHKQAEVFSIHLWFVLLPPPWRRLCSLLSVGLSVCLSVFLSVCLSVC